MSEKFDGTPTSELPFAARRCDLPALWEGYCTSKTVLTLDETKTAIQVLIDSLDDMLRDCEALGGAGAMRADKAGIQ